MRRTPRELDVWMKPRQQEGRCCAGGRKKPPPQPQLERRSDESSRSVDVRVVLTQSVHRPFCWFRVKVLEHYAWLKRENKNERLFFWSIVVLTQSICVGLPVAHVLLAFLIRSFPSVAFITVAAYMLPTLAVFIA